MLGLQEIAKILLAYKLLCQLGFVCYISASFSLIGKNVDSLVSSLHHSVKPIKACADFALFSGECEIEWAQKIAVEWRREQFLGIWGFVRVEIACHLTIAPSDLVFDRTSYGKPFLKSPAVNFSFNISHTKNDLAVCFHNSIAACGIDIEMVRPMQDRLSIAQRFYTKKEFLFLNAVVCEEKQNAYFFKLWVIKEAILKALGKGLSYGLDNVFIEDFESCTQGIVELVCEGESKKIAWQFFEDPTLEYVKAVALEIV